MYKITLNLNTSVGVNVPQNVRTEVIIGIELLIMLCEYQPGTNLAKFTWMESR